MMYGQLHTPSTSERSASQRSFFVGGIVCAFAVIALALVVSIATQRLDAQEIHGSIKSFTELALLPLAAVLFAFFSAQFSYRCPDDVISRCLKLLGALLALWMLLSMVRYSLPLCREHAIAFLWYCHYVPLIGSAMLSMIVSLRVSGKGSSSGFVLTVKVALLISALMTALILSNDLHHLAFDFSFADSHWYESYHRGPLYWMGLVWALAVILLGLAVMLATSRATLRSFVMMLVLVSVLAGLYAMLHAANALPLLFSNFSLGLAFLMFLGFLISVRSGIIPQVNNYGSLFQALPFDIRVISKNRELLFQTDLSQVKNRGMDDLPDGVADLMPGQIRRSSLDDDAVCLARGFNGGVGIMVRDIAAVNAHRRSLVVKNELLGRQNDLLESDLKVSADDLKLKEERRLFADVNDSTSWAINAIRALLEQLSEIDDDNVQERERRLLMVKLLLAYCKRKGSLVLSSSDGLELEAERVDMLMGEVAVDSRSAGIEFAALSLLGRPIPSNALSAMYDCVYCFVLDAYFRANPAIMVNVSETDGRFSLRIVMEGESPNRGESLEEVFLELYGETSPYVALETGEDFASLVVSDLQMAGSCMPRTVKNAKDPSERRCLWDRF